jgi:hypothetical protein
MIPSLPSRNPLRPRVATSLLAVTGWSSALHAQLIGPVPQPAPSATQEPTVATTHAAKPDAPSRADRLASLLRDLDADVLETRERAVRDLADLDLTQPELERLMRTPVLSPEQRARLDRLGPAVLYSTPRGALGVQFSNARDDLTITATVEGFDSCRVLKPGDEIESIEGHPITSVRDRRAPIIMNPPGSEITIRVLREGTPRTVRVRLGDFANLNGGRWDRVTLADCAMGWSLRTLNLRRDGVLAGLSPRVETGLDAETWHRASVDAGSINGSSTPWDPQDSGATILAGGQPRPAAPIFDPPEGAGFAGQGSDPIGLNAEILIKQDQRVADMMRLVEIQRQLAGNRLDGAVRDRLLAEMQDVNNRLFDLNDDRPLPRIP